MLSDKICVRVVVTSLLLIAVNSCAGLNAPTAPTQMTANGTWTGNITVQQQVAHSTWRLIQNATSVSGPIQIADAAGAVLLTGMLSGVLNGSTLSYSIDVPSGGVAAQPACVGRLEGKATLAQGAPSTLRGTYSWGGGSCDSGFSQGSFTLISGSPAMPVGPIAPSGG